jgi:hypothetical protein
MVNLRHSCRKIPMVRRTDVKRQTDRATPTFSVPKWGIYLINWTNWIFAGTPSCKLHLTNWTQMRESACLCISFISPGTRRTSLPQPLVQDRITHIITHIVRVPYKRNIIWLTGLTEYLQEPLPANCTWLTGLRCVKVHVCSFHSIHLVTCSRITWTGFGHFRQKIIRPTLMDTDMRLHYRLLHAHPAFRRQKSLANCIYNE